MRTAYKSKMMEMMDYSSDEDAGDDKENSTCRNVFSVRTCSTTIPPKINKAQSPPNALQQSSIMANQGFNGCQFSTLSLD